MWELLLKPLLVERPTFAPAKWNSYIILRVDKEKHRSEGKIYHTVTNRFSPTLGPETSLIEIAHGLHLRIKGKYPTIYKPYSHPYPLDADYRLDQEDKGFLTWAFLDFHTKATFLTPNSLGFAYSFVLNYLAKQDASLGALQQQFHKYNDEETKLNNYDKILHTCDFLENHGFIKQIDAGLSPFYSIT